MKYNYAEMDFILPLARPGAMGTPGAEATVEFKPYAPPPTTVEDLLYQQIHKLVTENNRRVGEIGRLVRLIIRTPKDTLSCSASDIRELNQYL